MIVSVCGALSVPTSCFGNGMNVLLRVSGTTPVPVRLTVWGLLSAVSVIVKVPVRVPPAVGENFKVTVQFECARIVAPQLLV